MKKFYLISLFLSNFAFANFTAETDFGFFFSEEDLSKINEYNEIISKFKGKNSNGEEALCNFEYTVEKLKTSNQKINNFLEKVYPSINDYMNSYEEFIKEIEQVAKEYEEIKNPFSCQEVYKYEMQYFGHYKNYEIFKENIYRYFGGANGGSSATYIMLSNEGKELSLKDILKDGAKEEIHKLLIIKDKERDGYDDKNPEELELLFTDNVYLSDAGLVFNYSPNEIAPFAEGFIRYELPFAEIKEYLKPEFLP